MEEIFHRYNPWWSEEYTLEGLIKRPSALKSLGKNLALRDIIFLTGLRRVGKTTLLKLFIKNLITDYSINPIHIFYTSLDDYNVGKKNLLELVEEFRKINKIRFKEKIYLFFDEVTYQENFEPQLKNLYDSQNVKIYASSSSASFLKSKKPYLTGRSKVMEILPLDFDEYLLFKGIEISKSDMHLKKSYFEEYLQEGGLPEYVLTKDIDYLKELVDDIIFKDIVAIHKIRNPQVLKDLFLLLMERAGKQVSINKVANILGKPPDTVKRYLTMFADTFLVYLLPRCGKTNEKILAPKKVYACDLGIKTFFTGLRDKGSLFENYVYLKIKSKKPCYLYKEGIEIDFLTNDDSLIEVKYHNQMSEKQAKYFKTTKAKEKIVIRNLGDLEKFVSS